jgi:carbonic anhydrase
MLAAIGITLILKQIPHALGNDSNFQGDLSFLQADGQNTLTEILISTDIISLGAFIIFIISIVLLMLWESAYIKNNKTLKFIPITLVVVILGALVNKFFGTFSSDAKEIFFLSSHHLVDLPNELSNGDYINLLTYPDFSAFSNTKVYFYAITLALVASVETLLSVEATDKLDPDKNISPNNMELKAQGIGNFISGLIGGLPITMVIVRSSANIDAKAKTQLSAFLHAVLLIISVFVFPTLMEMIPLASLAAILIILGFKLIKIKQLLISFKTDLESASAVLVTIVAVFLTDLLVGVGIGFAFSMFFILRKNYELAFISHTDKNETVISFAQIVSFLNKGRLMQTLQKIPPGTKVKMSAVRCHTMSKEIQSVIVDFRDITSERNNIDLELIGFEKFDLINAKKEID